MIRDLRQRFTLTVVVNMKTFNVVFCFIIITDVSRALRCLDCRGLLSPLMCQRLIWCPSKEMCVTEKIQTFNGETLYNVGCANQNVCQNMTDTQTYSQSATDPRRIHGSAITDHEDRLICRSCCDGDACNLLGCGTIDSPSVRGPLCYTCPQTANPDHCSSVSVCNTGEECHIHDENRFGISYFTMSCKSKFDCGDITGTAFGRKRRTTDMSKCCSADLCNVNVTEHSITTLTTPGTVYKAFDCLELKEHGFRSSGVYYIYPNGTEVRVYCDMDTAGGGWTVISKRLDDSLAFNRSWSEYKDGFGSAAGNYWIGNSFIHTLTVGKNKKIYFSLQFRDGTWKYAQYNDFYVASESEKFRLSYNGQSYIGNAGNALYGHENRDYYPQGMYFSTYDRDNDGNNYGSCARSYGGGWWYGHCHQLCLTGTNGTGGYEWHETSGGVEDYLIASIMMIK